MNTSDLDSKVLENSQDQCKRDFLSCVAQLQDLYVRG